MKKITLCLPVLLFFTSICFAQSSGNIVLNKGQKLMVESSSNAVITQEAMGQSMEIKIDSKTSNTIEVKDVKPDAYSLTNTITKMKMSMNMQGQDMNYDSEKAEDKTSEMGKGMSEVINVPKDIDMSKSGKPVALKTEKKPDAGGADMMGNIMQGMMGGVDDGTAGLGLAFQPLPAKATPGFNWTDTTNKDGSKTNTTYTIKEINGTDAIVDIKGTVQVTKKTEAQGMEITSNSSGKVTGNATVDINTGIVKQRNATVETTGTVEVMGQEMPMTTKVTSSTTVTKM